MKRTEVIKDLSKFIKDNYLLPDIYNDIIKMGKKYIIINPPLGIIWLKIAYKDITSIFIINDNVKPEILINNPNWQVIIYLNYPLIKFENIKGKQIEIYSK
jgi:hypothetical protein